MPQNDYFLSPLRYPGSKRWLASFIKKALTLNKISPKLYIEPFAGGASVALQLMVENAVDQVILMDLDPLIAYFWETLFFDTDWLIDQIESIDVTIEKWYEYKQFQPKTKREYAIACLFLNRTSFSGIIRDEIGPLGGRNQESKYKIDCRFPRTTLIDRIIRIADYRDKIFSIWSCSWLDGVKKIRKLQIEEKLPIKDLFFYLDPPFFERANRLYRCYFHQEDHTELRDFLINLKDYWILSYDSSPKIEELYSDAIKNRNNGAKRKHLDIYYSIAIMSEQRIAKKEMVISNLSELPT